MNNQYLRIKNQQKSDGSFSNSVGLSSVFYTALILSCLNNCKKNNEIDDVRKKAFDFLLQKKDKNWKFSDNLGINFTVLFALTEYDKNLIDGEAIAKILNELVSVEVREGGPYHNKENREVDLFSNVAVAYFLFLQEVELEELTNLIENAIETKNFNSSFFESPLPILCLISRFYKGDKADKLKNELGQNNCPNKEEILNDAFCLEIFDRTDIKDSEKQFDKVIFSDDEKNIIDKIIKEAEKRLVDFSEEFKQTAINCIKEIINQNSDKQMSFMSYYTKLALGQKATKISDELITKMALANIFFWKAFIIYDDFWDEDESANPKILPMANLFARSYVDFFDFVLPESTGFHKFFHKIMDNLDSANTWENVYCRTKIEGSKFFILDKLPDYGNYEKKYYPASGHILGPVAMLVSLGYSIDSSEVKNFILYFKNYLIAMQINDDVHDWEEDLRRGHISTVIDILLRDLNWQTKEIDLDKDLDELKRVFWFKTMPKAEELAVSYTKKARQALLSVGIFENLAPLEKYIDITENSAKKALDEQKKSVEFLNNLD